MFMTDRFYIYMDIPPYTSWYSPNSDAIFLTRYVNEVNIDYIMEHETLHRVLNNFINFEASWMLDEISLGLWYFINGMREKH